MSTNFWSVVYARPPKALKMLKTEEGLTTFQYSYDKCFRKPDSRFVYTFFSSPYSISNKMKPVKARSSVVRWTVALKIAANDSES